MSTSLSIALFSTLFVGFAVQRVFLSLAFKYRWLDIPTSRRRHSKPTPVIGGVGVVLTWVLGLMIYSAMDPSWLNTNAGPLGILLGCVSCLVALGLVDDLKGLSPTWKLTVETVLAIVLVASEPAIRDICVIWSNGMGAWGGIVWVMAILWVVGITNAINLIDGLDGLAGGTSAIVFSSVVVLCFLVQDQAQFPLIFAAILIPAVLSFLRYNWPPASVFLGDNGSLPLGFLIAASSLMCRPHSKSWIMIAGLVLTMGYPILDMGLAVLRRYRLGYPLFKADRNHLHYRIQRLGLSTEQSTILLLILTVYLQIAGLFVNFAVQRNALISLGISTFSISIFLYMVYSLERHRVEEISRSIRGEQGLNHTGPKLHQVIHLELATFFEAALMEERNRYLGLSSALEVLLRSMLAPGDRLFMADLRISILVMQSSVQSPQYQEVLSQYIERVRVKVEAFLNLYEIQCSMAGIPITIGELVLIEPDHERESPVEEPLHLKLVEKKKVS